MKHDLDKVYLHAPVPRPIGRAREAVSASVARVLPLIGCCTEDFLQRLIKVYGWPINIAARAELERRASLEA